ncbi:MAG: cytochrome c biogenesis protein ResB [Cyanothece sp. SIO1E1]|nr:cytochrome c biogenesis protein ResB [Cyanothece sp. SIO1E1]
MVSKFIRFLGSIRLAVPLLVAIALILIGATFYESEVGSVTVQHEIYKSAWFGALMFMLAMNLGISTLTRYPWRGARKVGFAFTHIGLIVIIAGSAAVIHLSTEGMLLVRTDSGPNNQVRVEGDLLEVIAPDQSRQQTDIFVKSDGSVHPSQFAGLSLLGYSDNAIKTVAFTNGGAVDNLAVQLKLSSDRMGQTLERWLAVAPTAYNQVDMGPAHLEIAQADSERDLQALLSQPDQTQADLGKLQITTTQGNALSLDIQPPLGQSTQLPNGITVKLINVWPDFRLNQDNQPTSASDQFRNPAVQLALTDGNIQASWFVFSQTGFEPIRSGDEIDVSIAYEAPTSTATDYFRVVVAPNHQLFYAALSSKGFKSGEFKPGQAVTPGWADFQITLADVVEWAQIQRSIVPVTPVAQAALADQGSPALHVATAAGDDYWLPWGEPTTLNTTNGSYFAAFSPKLLQLPFMVKLDNFIVERNEGSESVAMWTSDITLSDPHQGQQVQRHVWMNHPTWFAGWKLAQASWNPGDLKQSTLQLKREPWWVTALTWTGSMLVVMGIGTMFYGPAIAKRLRQSSRTELQPKLDETDGDQSPAQAQSDDAPNLVAMGK